MPRLFELTTPLGDVLMFRRMNGYEELGRLSQFDVSALSTKGDISPADLLGKKVTVKVELRNNAGYRYFNGYVTRFAQGAMVGRYYEYHMTVSPWLWFLTRTADCRIFQDKTAHEIILEVFNDPRHAGLPDYDDACIGKYVKREYCVQYRETDFDFVSRLMEEEGIYYYFEHSDGRHVLTLVDSDSGHKPMPNKASIAFLPPGHQVRVDEEYIHQWRFDQSIQPGLVEMRDYDFTKPRVDLTVKNKKIEKHDFADYEVFDWPGEYRETDYGEQLARARIEELHSEFERVRAACNVREIAVGRLFKLSNFPRQDQQRVYLILRAEWDLLDNPYESAPGEPASYRAAFTAMPDPAKHQFRPARLTPRPTVKGVHSAVVTGPAGEEIYTDQYGRVKVQFHWDRYGKRDENSSCWIRVSHPWAGKGWGAVSIPRIGQEVIVDFLEGDPDQPLIMGRVYNAETMPPYGLPAGGVVSGIKSNTTKGGGGYNELSMNDTKGKEHFTVHAQYDMSTTVQHDDTQTIHNNRKVAVDGTHTETITGATSVTIGKGPYKLDVQANTYTHHTKGDVTELFDATQGTFVAQNVMIQSLNAQITIDAKTELHLHCGDSLITMKADGTIRISGKDIEISGTATTKIGVGNQNVACDVGKVATSGAAINSSATGTHEITGALVKIN